MKQYYIRLFCAWLLLRVASGLVKDAEQLLKQSADKKMTLADTNGTAPAATVIEGTVVDG